MLQTCKLCRVCLVLPDNVIYNEREIITCEVHTMNFTDFTYDEAHNLKIRLRMPEGVENPPLFIYIHGGGIENGNYMGNQASMEMLTSDGIATAAIGYRLYPNAKYPEFIEDCAAAVAFMKNLPGYSFKDIYVGGSSAGSYLSMMLFFDPKYLGAHGIDPLDLAGYVFDAGQPTVHFNVLRERGMDTRLLRVDEAAPIYHITKNYDTSRNLPKIVHIAASQDIKCRLQQVQLLQETMRHFGYPDDKNKFYYMNGYTHCKYSNTRAFVDLVETIAK